MTTPPSTLISLADLHTCAAGAKVRFLGCVKSYNIQSGILSLTTSPASSTSAPIPSPPIARIQTSLIRHTAAEGLQHDARFDEGAWLNVIGYIVRSEAADGQWKGEGAGVSTMVQATMLWIAEGVKGDGGSEARRFEKVVRARKEVGRVLADVAGRGR